MERFIPEEIFQNKGNTFRGLTFFPFLPKFSVPFFWITSARLHDERERKIYRYFVNGTAQSRSCFRCQKKIPVPFDGNFHRNFVQMVSAPLYKLFPGWLISCFLIG